METTRIKKIPATDDKGKNLSLKGSKTIEDVNVDSNDKTKLFKTVSIRSGQKDKVTDNYPYSVSI